PPLSSYPGLAPDGRQPWALLGTLSAFAWVPYRAPSAMTSPLAFMGDALGVCSSVRPPEKLAAPSRERRRPEAGRIINAPVT
ncbi:MAG: hypothetical protein K2X38_09795, partial [Gemmataceae bacterium]|nr:hypothetical protein [Gemmataceae bacterium]